MVGYSPVEQDDGFGVQFMDWFKSHYYHCSLCQSEQPGKVENYVVINRKGDRSSCHTFVLWRGLPIQKCHYSIRQTPRLNHTESHLRMSSLSFNSLLVLYCFHHRYPLFPDPLCVICLTLLLGFNSAVVDRSPRARPQSP